MSGISEEGGLMSCERVLESSDIADSNSYKRVYISMFSIYRLRTPTLYDLEVWRESLFEYRSTEHSSVGYNSRKEDDNDVVFVNLVCFAQLGTT
jgi:hypothetical protein